MKVAETNAPKLLSVTTVTTVTHWKWRIDGDEDEDVGYFQRFSRNGFHFAQHLNESCKRDSGQSSFSIAPKCFIFLLKMFCAVLFVLLIRFDHSICIMNEMAIDINDIMSDKLMPTSFFVIEGTEPIDNATTSNLFNNITSVLLPKIDGNFQSAYKLMNFHR